MKVNAYAVFGVLLSGIHFMSWGTTATSPATPRGGINHTATVSPSYANVTLVTDATSAPSPRNTTTTASPSQARNGTTSAPAASDAPALPAGNTTAAPIGNVTALFPSTIVLTYNVTSNVTVSPANNITTSTPNLTNGSRTTAPNKGVMASAGPGGKVNATAGAVPTSRPTTNAMKAPSVHNTTTTSAPVADTSRDGPTENATKNPSSTGNAITTSVPVAKTTRNGVPARPMPPFWAFALLVASGLFR